MQVPSSSALFLMLLYHKLSTVPVKIRKKPAYQLSIFPWYTSNFLSMLLLILLLGIISSTSIKFKLYVCLQIPPSTCLEKRGTAAANEAF